MKKPIAVAVAVALLSSSPVFATERDRGGSGPTTPQEPIVITEYVYKDNDSKAKNILTAITGVVIGMAIAAILCYNSDKCMGDNVAREKAQPVDPNPDSIVPANANPGRITIEPVK